MIGGDIILISTPSTLILTFTLSLPGSIWTSVEPSLIASLSIKFTSFTKGASSAETFSVSRLSSSPSSSSPLIILIFDIALATSPLFLTLSYSISNAFSIELFPATRISGFKFVSFFIESKVDRSSGSSIAIAK